MASEDHTINSGSSNPDYEIVKHIKIDIKNEPEDPNLKKWNIYKVPCNLRSLNESAYTPQLISIGPLHYGREKLNPMQTQKLLYLKFFRRRVKNNLDQFKQYLTSKEADIRQCYAEKLRYDIDKVKYDIDEEKLVEMMLLDSVFIMELFLRVQRQKSEEDNKNGKNVEKQTYPDDIIMKQSWLNKSIQRDLLLLENQIPLFILQELYNIVPDKKRTSFIELAHDYFDCYHAYKKAESCSDQETAASSSSNGKPSKDKPQHFTDLIRSFYICKNLDDFKKRYPFKNATKLRESGVSFEKEKVDYKPLLDIKFEKIAILSWFLCLGCFPNFTYFKARLQVPELKVDDTTECVLRNLIAFEQCHYPNQPYICSYVSFIDSLIHTKDDVELLVEKEVIRHELGSHKEVATLVNGLCKYVVSDKTCYADKIKSLNEHYQNQWYRTIATLRLVYFRDTWRASSTLVGIVVLAFTIFNFWRVVRLVLDLDRRGRP
ncbi:hypothetical protein QN277_023577 [Acacia crassicarpa]|uniref:Uncharacterized protein n=1 Tax=Acacia crassicarpa TaxID=499986 RepID=A0AAE1JM32_9FABA|nr:hypothetical protein QN277_023577 [Acacia crassicarpa]